MTYIKLPHINRVKDYMDFYKKLLKNFKQPIGTLINNTQIFLTTENELALSNHLRDLARKENKHLTDKSFNWSWGLEWLQCSPSTNHGSAKNGYAFIEDERKLFVKKDVKI